MDSSSSSHGPSDGKGAESKAHDPAEDAVTGEDPEAGFINVERDPAARDAPYGRNAGAHQYRRDGRALVRRVPESQEFKVSILDPTGSSVSPDIVTAYTSAGPLAEQMRSLRSQLKNQWLVPGGPGRNLAVVSAERGSGRSFLAANLAVVLSQLGEGRILLVDGDILNPRQHQLFGIDNRIGLTTALIGMSGNEAIRAIAGLHNLFVLPAGPQFAHPDDLLARDMLSLQLRNWSGLFQVIVIDTPVWGVGDAARSIARHARSALMVIRPGETRTAAVSEMSHELRASGAALMGVVVNSISVDATRR